MKPRIFDSKFSTTTSTKGLLLMRAQIRTRDQEAVKFVKELCALWNDIEAEDWRQIITILEMTGARVAGARLNEMFGETKVVHAMRGRGDTWCGAPENTNPTYGWSEINCLECLRAATNKGSRGARDRLEELGG